MSDTFRNPLEYDREYASAASALMVVSSMYEPKRRREFQVALVACENSITIFNFLEKMPVGEVTEILSSTHRTLLGVFIAAAMESTPAEVLDALANSENTYLRIVVGINPSTPIDTLKRLSRDDKDAVRYAVLINPSSPSEIIASIPMWETNSLLSMASLQSAVLGLT